jgi:hypothetical protein
MQRSQYSRDYDAGYRSGSQPEYGGQGSMGSNPAQAQVTTHGLGTGQSIQRQQEIQSGMPQSQGQEYEHRTGSAKGQEFGRGEEQVSNYKGNETKPASQSVSEREATGKSSGDKGHSDKQGGELR